MAKSGFVPAWMKISSSDKTNGNQNETNSTIITGRQRHHSSDVIDHTTARHRLFNYSKTNGQSRNKSNEQQSLNDLDRQSENVFSFQSRRSYSRERLTNSFGKTLELNGNDSSSSPNNHSSINSSANPQRRLHSVSSSYTNNRQNLINGNNFQHLSNDNHSDMTIKTNENTFDRLEKDFPSLSGRELSPTNNDQSSIWNNAASKFRISTNENLSRLIPRQDRLLSTPNNFTIQTRSIIPDLQTNCITQTKNLDKRSEFLNSLKNDLTLGEPNDLLKSPRNSKITKEILLLLSVPETSEEKEFLVRMGWNDDDMTYEITDKDKEEYEKRTKLLPKTDNRSAALLSALNRRTLPCVNIQDVLQLEMIGSISDDDSSDD